MKNKLLTTSILLALLGIMNTAIAATYTDTYTTFTEMEARPSHLNDAHNWQFDITLDGFDPTAETITDASITLLFQDDTDTIKYEFGRFSEFAEATIGGVAISEWQVTTGSKQFTVTSLATLGLTGILNMSISASGGDFYFLGGTLTANTATVSPSAVPAPSALLLMGSGLIGIATAARRKAKKA